MTSEAAVINVEQIMEKRFFGVDRVNAIKAVVTGSMIVLIVILVITHAQIGIIIEHRNDISIMLHL